MTGNIVIQDSDLIGAIETCDQLIDMLRQIQAAGIEVTVEAMALASLHDDDDDPRRTAARLSLLLAVALQSAASQ